MDIRQHVFDAINRERTYQDHKWGGIADHPHTVAEWILILESELQEAKKAWVHGKGDAAALCEILQVAAVAVATLEQHGCVGRDDPCPHAD